MNEKIKNLWEKVKTFLKEFFNKPENLGIVFMVLALICFFSFANAPIEGLILPWQADKLGLKLTLQTGLLALIFEAVLYLKGVYDIGINVEETDTKKVLGAAVKFIINAAIFTSFFAILFPVTKSKTVFDVFKSVFKKVMFGAGFIGGVTLIGSRDTAFISSALMLALFVWKQFKNLTIVSNAAKTLGWFYIVFLVLGFILQNNFSLTRLATDLKNAFPIFERKGKQYVKNVGKALDDVSEKGKEMINTASTDIQLASGSKKLISKLLNKDSKKTETEPMTI